MKSKIILFFLAVNTLVCAQESPFDGSWIGYVYDEKDELVNFLLIEIEGESVTQYGYNSESEEYYVMEFDVQKFHTRWNNALYLWLNEGGVWSETHTYHMSLVNDSKADLIWTRQVNNVKDGDNEVWYVQAKGHMDKIVENTYNAPFVEAQSFNYFTVKSVTVDDQTTRVVLTWNNAGDEKISGTFHGPDSENAMYITDRNRQHRYHIKDIEGVTFGSQVTVEPGESIDVTLHFAPTGDLMEFDIIEPGTAGTTWNFYGIVLSQ